MSGVMYNTHTQSYICIHSLDKSSISFRQSSFYKQNMLGTAGEVKMNS